MPSRRLSDIRIITFAGSNYCSNLVFTTGELHNNINRQKYFSFHVKGRCHKHPEGREGGSLHWIFNPSRILRKSHRLYFSSKKSLRKSLRSYFSSKKSLRVKIYPLNKSTLYLFPMLGNIPPYSSCFSFRGIFSNFFSNTVPLTSSSELSLLNHSLFS